MTFSENYLQPAKHKIRFTKSRWIPKYTNWDKLSHWQAVHIPHSLQTQQQVLDWKAQT